MIEAIGLSCISMFMIFTPMNNYLYWFGLGIFHSGIEGQAHDEPVKTCPCQITTYPQPHHRLPHCFLYPVLLNICLQVTRLYVIFKAVHGMEYGFGAHEYPSSGVFDVEPKSSPGFVFRRSVLFGSTDMSRSDFQSFIEHLSSKYHGDTYHLITKNCNHFTDDLCRRLTGKPIPGWVNHLARLGSFCNCLLLENIQVTTVRIPDHPIYSDDDGSESLASSVSVESEGGDSDHRLITSPNGGMAYPKDKPVKLARELL